MANIVLVNPYNPKFLITKEKHVPLGLLYLASYLKKNGHAVKLIDLYNEQASNGSDNSEFNLIESFKTNIRKTILSFEPALIGVSVHFSGRFHPAIKICSMIKDYFSEIPIVIGGIHPSLFPREILEEYECTDFILQGESESTLVELVETIENREYNYDRIDGLGYRENGIVVVNKKEHFIDNVDEIPFPDYDIIDIKNYYFDTSKWRSPKGLPINISVYILSSRSCPRQCNYCSMFVAQGPTYRSRSAINVVDEIEYLYSSLNQRYFSFMDDNFTFSKKRAIEICNEILKRKLNIQFDTPNGLDINTLNDEVIEALVNAGMVRTCLAIESGSPKIRKSINKPLKQEKIYSVFESVKKHSQLVYNTFFVVGFPEETHETLEETYLLIKELELPSAVISFATPFPGTKLFEECVENNIIDIDTSVGLHNLDQFYFARAKPFIKPYKLERQDLIDFRQKIYTELDMANLLEVLKVARMGEDVL